MRIVPVRKTDGISPRPRVAHEDQWRPQKCFIGAARWATENVGWAYAAPQNQKP